MKTRFRVPRPTGTLKGPGRTPVTLRSEGESPLVLAFHGFGGTPFEVEPAIEAARDLGLAAEAPLLPGHGTHASELARTTWKHWSDAARAAFDRAPGKRILVGFSMGSLLAIDLAAERPESVSGLVLLANAAWLSAPFPSWALALAERLRLPDFLAPKSGPDIADEAARETHESYDSHPVHAAIEVFRAGIRMRERLAQICCPTLILHGARDRVCPVANAWRVGESLGTDDCRIVIFPRSRHILTRDIERAAVRREVVSFLTRIQLAEASALPSGDVLRM